MSNRLQHCTRVGLLAAILWLAAAPALAQTPTLRPVLGATYATPGDTVDVAITAGSAVAPVRDLFGLSFELDVDGSAVDIVDASTGPFLQGEGTLLTFDSEVGSDPSPYSITRVRPAGGADGYGTVVVFEAVVAAGAADGDYGFVLADVEAVDSVGAPVDLGASSATLTVGSTPLSTLPAATDDAAEVDEDAVTIVDVLANDGDADGDALSVTDVTLPSHGLAVVNGDHTITYTPAADFNGQDAFQYTVADGDEGEDRASVAVTIHPVNDPPEFVGRPDTALTENVIYAGAVAASDVDGDPLTLSAADAPTWLTLTDHGDGTAGLSGTPTGFDVGEHYVTFVVSDGAASTDRAVTFVVAQSDAPPTALDDHAGVDEDASTLVDVLANDSDPNGDAISIVSASQAAHGAVTVATDTTLRYTPEADYHGTDRFTYIIEDADGGRDSADVHLRVRPTNDAPRTAAAPGDLSLARGGVAALVALDPLFDDIDGDTLIYRARSSADAIAALAVAGSTLTVTPLAEGVARVTVTGEDDDGASASAAFDVTVATPPPDPPSPGVPTNGMPVAAADSATTRAGLAVTIDVLANDADPDGDTLSIDAVASPAHGSVSVVGEVVRYVPDAGFFGADAFSYEVVDGAGGSASGDVVVTVTPSADLSVTIEISPFSAAPGQDVTVRTTVRNAGPTAASNVRLTVDAAAAISVTSGCTTADCSAETLAAGASFDVVVEAAAPDSSGAFPFSVSVTSATSDPEPRNDAASADLVIEKDEDGVSDDVEDGAPNDGDGNGDGVKDSDQENVTSVANDDGEYVTIASEDSTKLQRVRIRDNPSPDDAPADVEFPVGVLEFGIDRVRQGEPSTVTINVPPSKTVTSYWKYGSTPDETAPHWYEFLYDGETGAEIFPDRIVLHFVDGQRGDADLAANGSIEDPGAPVFAENGVPAAEDDAIVLEEDASVLVDVLANDRDADGDSLRIYAVRPPTHGSTAVDPPGVRYEPDADYFGADAFTYVIDDHHGAADSAVVQVDVRPVNDPPASPSVTAPHESVVVAGDPAEELMVTWTASTDADGDTLTYVWVLAATRDFEDVLVERTTTKTQIRVTYAELAELLDAMGGDAVLYQWVTADDGTASAQSEVVELSVTRGALTARGRDELPESVALAPNYPNPFNPSTTVSFSVPRTARVRLEVFDVLGRRVRLVVDRDLPAGRYERRLSMDGLPSGMYVYRLRVGTITRVRRMILTK